MNKSNHIAVTALLSAIAILLGYLEHLIPIVPPIAGIKLGLGNIAVLLALRILKSRKIALGILLTKILVCAALFAGMGSLPYSLAGGAASLALMALLCESGRLSSAGISAAGGAVHMAAQVTVAAWITSTAEIFTLLPILVAVGTMTGLLNGVIVNLMQKNVGTYLTRQ